MNGVSAVQAEHGVALGAGHGCTAAAGSGKALMTSKKLGLAGGTPPRLNLTALRSQSRDASQVAKREPLALWWSRNAIASTAGPASAATSLTMLRPEARSA